MSLLVPDESCLVLLSIFFYLENESDLAFHPGPVQPPGGEGSPLSLAPYFSHFIAPDPRDEFVPLSERFLLEPVQGRGRQSWRVSKVSSVLTAGSTSEFYSRFCPESSKHRQEQQGATF